MYTKKNQLRTARVVEFVNTADDCTCHQYGYCAIHGTYTPVVLTDTNGDAVTITPRVPANHRVVRKKVGK